MNQKSLVNKVAKRANAIILLRLSNQEDRFPTNLQIKKPFDKNAGFLVRFFYLRNIEENKKFQYKNIYLIGD